MTEAVKTEGLLEGWAIFEGWAIIELMGHRKLGGYLSEQVIAGTAFIRIDAVSTEGVTIATQFYSASAVYCVTPTTQDVATAYGTNHKPEPVTRWELPSAKVTPIDNGYDHHRHEFSSSDYEEDDIPI